MTASRPEEYIFYRGRRFRVEFYYGKDGRIPAKEYFDAMTLPVQVRLAVLVKYIAEEGRLFDIAKFRIVDQAERIYEFKPLEHRFFNYCKPRPLGRGD